MSNRKIFLDCGGHKGAVIGKFKRTTFWEDDFEIFSFEAHPSFASKYQEEVIENETYLNKAVWIEDGEIQFFVGKQFGGKGCSIFSNKKTGRLDKENPITVESIDFSKWVTDNFDKDDHIILGMDIEGAEYEVLEKMLVDGSIDYINIACIEFHRKKISIPKVKHNNLIARLKEKVEMRKFQYIK
jgi:FkbM family methyltransferase